MTEPLDIDKIEEELKQISPWPWEAVECGVDEMFFGMPEAGEGYRNFTDMGDIRHVDAEFMAKAPERIAALVKRVRELEEALKCISEASLNNFSDPSTCMKEYADKILRGSDE